MAAGTSPIFSQVVQNWFSDAVIATANTTLDLTSGTIYLLATAGADGAHLDRLYLQPIGTNTASVARLWINNGGTTGTAANNRWFKDFTLPATTNSIVASIPSVEAQLNLKLQITYRLYLTLGTTVAAGYHGVVEGGNF